LALRLFQGFVQDKVDVFHRLLRQILFVFTLIQETLNMQELQILKVDLTDARLDVNPDILLVPFSGRGFHARSEAFKPLIHPLANSHLILRHVSSIGDFRLNLLKLFFYLFLGAAIDIRPSLSDG